MTLGPRSFPALILVMLIAFAVACGSNPPSSSTPPSPTPTTTPPPATPPPTTQPPAAKTSCEKLGFVSGATSSCPRESPTFLTAYEQAVDQLINQKPQIFDGTGTMVRSTGQFYVGVIKNLEAMGLCATFDGEEIAITNTKAYNDQIHAVTSGGIVRRGQAAYRATCYPSAIPTPPPPFPPNNGCSLPPSLEITCGREEPVYLGEVEAGIEQLAREHPEYFDLTDHQSGTDWFKILNPDGYVNGMISVMKSRNFCARHDGEELVIKRTSDFSEHYDIETQNGYIRRGSGAYRSTCYPAAF